MGRSQGRAVIKTISRKPLTKAQLNQALIAEAYRRNSVHVSELLAQGANPNAAQRGGVTPLVMAVSLGNLEAVRLLVEAGAIVNPGTSTHAGASSGQISPLSVAVASRSLHREAVLLEMLDHGADVNGRDAQNNPPLVVGDSGGGFCRSAATHSSAEVAFRRVD